MEIKRNIFDSSAKMPPRNETVSAAFATREDAGYVQHEQMQSSVKHAPVPHIGEQK